MSDDNNGLDAQQDTGVDFDNFDFSALPPSAQSYIKNLRSENKKRREALQKSEEEAKKQNDIRLAEEGRWRELADQREKDVLRLKPFEEGYTQITALISEGNQAILKTLPEHVRKAAPMDYPPEKLRVWLDTIAPILTKPPAPDLNQGVGGSGGTQQTAQLSNEEKAIARKFGMTDEEYAKNK